MAERTWVDVRQDARGVAVVTIDNPAKLNTLNTRVMTELVAAVEQLGNEASLRAVRTILPHRRHSGSGVGRLLDSPCLAERRN